MEAQSNLFTLDWGRSLTAGKRTDTEASDGDSVDFGTGSTDFGLQAYLHVFAFTGTSVTVKLQESSDDAAARSSTPILNAASETTSSGSEVVAAMKSVPKNEFPRPVNEAIFSPK